MHTSTLYVNYEVPHYLPDHVQVCKSRHTLGPKSSTLCYHLQPLYAFSVPREVTSYLKLGRSLEEQKLCWVQYDGTCNKTQLLDNINKFIVLVQYKI